MKARWLRLSLAVVGAPLLASMLWSAVYAAFVPYVVSDSTLPWFNSWVLYVFMAAIMSLVVMIVGGLPAHALLMRFKRTRWFEYTGAASALVVVGWMVAAFGRATSLQAVAEGFLAAATFGALLGLLAWLIRRPDRDAITAPRDA
jgi:hypothetical protein